MPPAQPTRIKPWLLRPHDEALGADTHAFLDWVQSTLNVLVGQQVPPGTGSLALNTPNIDPTSAQILSVGGRVGSLSPGFSFSAPSTTQINLFWDGTNSSTVLRIYRDDGTVAGPFPGSQSITGLVAATTYFFYPYFDEATQLVKFVSQAGATGSPPIAYTTKDIKNAIAQILRGRIPLASNLADTGVATPAAGNTPATSVGGSGGSGGAFLGRGLK